MLRRLWILISVLWTAMIWWGVGLRDNRVPSCDELVKRYGNTPGGAKIIMPAQLPLAELGHRAKAHFQGAYDDLSDAEVGHRLKARYPGVFGPQVTDYYDRIAAKYAGVSEKANPKPAGAIPPTVVQIVESGEVEFPPLMTDDEIRNLLSRWSHDFRIRRDVFWIGLVPWIVLVIIPPIFRWVVVGRCW